MICAHRRVEPARRVHLQHDQLRARRGRLLDAAARRSRRSPGRSRRPPSAAAPASGRAAADPRRPSGPASNTRRKAPSSVATGLLATRVEVSSIRSPPACAVIRVARPTDGSGWRPENEACESEVLRIGHLEIAGSPSTSLGCRPSASTARCFVGTVPAAAAPAPAVRHGTSAAFAPATGVRASRCAGCADASSARFSVSATGTASMPPTGRRRAIRRSAWRVRLRQAGARRVVHQHPVVRLQLGAIRPFSTVSERVSPPQYSGCSLSPKCDQS